MTLFPEPFRNINRTYPDFSPLYYTERTKVRRPLVNADFFEEGLKCQQRLLRLFDHTKMS